ncbi:transposase, mutator type [mine drainage metagenome]|uniref:Transposase, mutator type n=1 Tax=mine drainage metagenome TaxID=410659 RepID=T1AA17_9ZZZZ
MAYRVSQLFVDAYQAKYPKATDCLTKDREVLLAFYEFRPNTGRTSNPIESSFATIPYCTPQNQGCDGRDT